ncbi:MAG: hypothetical protein K6E75_01480 [Lachnospiraceae bacterium]|nr:hypothetical protein [Lachnospiraceae bacterium]
MIVGKFYVRLSETGRSNLRKAIGLSVILLDALKITVMGLFGVNYMFIGMRSDGITWDYL